MKEEERVICVAEDDKKGKSKGEVRDTLTWGKGRTLICYKVPLVLLIGIVWECK